MKLMLKYSMLSTKYSTVIIGLGKTGLSVARYLQRQNKPFAVCDISAQPKLLTEFQRDFPEVPIFCGELDTDLLSQAQCLIVSPGISIHTPAIAAAAQARVEIIGDVELFVRQAKAPIMAITGSNGKTTVTTLVGEMAQAAGLNIGVGGNIGIPVLDLLDQAYDLYVLELSSFQLETATSLKATVAVNLNVSDDHLDRYATLADYVAAKDKIYHNASIAVLNLDDVVAWQNAAITGERFGFSLEKNLAENCSALDVYFTVQDDYIVCGKEKWLALNELKLRGKHHLANMLASFALAYAVNLPKVAMLHVAKTFTGLPHRCQEIATYDNITWINDSKATNVGAAIAAIESIGKNIQSKIILIAGGDGKNASFSDLAVPVLTYCRVVILLGKDAQRLADSLAKEMPKILVQNLPAAVQTAKQRAQSGDVVLLSPACSSLDMFTNYMARGEQFISMVSELYK